MKEPLETNPDKAYKIVKDGYKTKKNIIWLNPLGFNNTYTITMRTSQANELNINKISDLVPHAANLNFACEAEFFERPDGLPGLLKTYNIKFSKVSSMDSGLVYAAARDGQVDVIDAFAELITSSESAEICISSISISTCLKNSSFSSIIYFLILVIYIFHLLK